MADATPTHAEDPQLPAIIRMEIGGLGIITLEMGPFLAERLAETPDEYVKPEPPFNQVLSGPHPQGPVFALASALEIIGQLGLHCFTWGDDSKGVNTMPLIEGVVKHWTDRLAGEGFMQAPSNLTVQTMTMDEMRSRLISQRLFGSSGSLADIMGTR